jgi:hypothetical protein
MTGEDVAAGALIAHTRQSKSETTSNQGHLRDCFIGGFFPIFSILDR